MKIKILLADDHFVVRMGLAAIIRIEKDFQLVGEASDGLEAVAYAESLNPDVIILDLMMPNLDGVQATARILERRPGAKILILTTFGSAYDIQRALDAGACGALVKDSSHEELVAAIRAVARGERTICPSIAQQMSVLNASPRLSARQVEILTYVAKGLRNREIAPLLGITPDCVKAHVRAAIASLGASSRPEAVAIAIQHNIIQR